FDSIGMLAGVPVMTVIAVAVIAITVWALACTRFGRYSYATGSDPVAGERAGINVRGHTMKIYVLAGLAYGLAAYLNVARFSTTTIGGHAPDALNAITGVALGGVSIFGGSGSAVGAAIGIFVPAVLQNGLVIVRVPPYWQQIAIAVALVGAVYADLVRRRTNHR
ncbi:ABC transporter permease, partial [Frankia sp. CcWB3]